MSLAADETDRRESSDLTELIRVLWRGRIFIAGCAITFAVVAAILAYSMTPNYRSSTILVPADDNGPSIRGSLGSALGSIGGLAAIANLGLGSSGAVTDEALAVLRSRQFTDKFIADRQLMSVLFSEEWDPEQERWNVSKDRQPTAFRAFDYFDRKVRYVVEDSNTGLVTLRIDWKDRELAADWANDLILRLNAEMRQRAIMQADASIAYLEKELERTNLLETRTAISRLVEMQINRRMVASVTEQYAFRVVDRAVPADVDQMVRPKKTLMILVGACLGALMGSMLALLFRGRIGFARARRQTLEDA